MRRILIAGALALSATLAACATATPYQPNVRGQAVSGGFTDVRLTDDRYRVTFSGNSLTNRDTVERYMLYRAAELTLTSGYDWFELDERRTDRDRQTYIEPDLLSSSRFGPWGYGYWQPQWRYYGRPYGWRTWDPFWGRPFFSDTYDVRTVEKFEASAEIILHRGPAPTGASRAFDARQVQANLEPTIIRPQPR
jgi:hypothetical protein